MINVRSVLFIISEHRDRYMVYIPDNRGRLDLYVTFICICFTRFVAYKLLYSCRDKKGPRHGCKIYHFCVSVNGVEVLKTFN